MKNNIERLFDNIQKFVKAGVLEEEFKVFASENPELDSIEDLCEIMEDEISYWDE